MECAYCHNNTAQYEEEEGLEPLQYCSYTCQTLHRTINDDDHLSLYMNALTLDAPVVAVKAVRKRPVTLGPDSELPYTIPVGLRKFMLNCTRYVAGLPLFDQYIIWRYTMGSASINAFLIFGKISNTDNAVYWVFLFFLFWRNTEQRVGRGNVAPQFAKFEQFFRDPDSLMALPAERRLVVAEQVIPLYIRALDRLIRQTPRVEEGFHVFKVAGNYPGLPTSPKDVPKKVKQLPFNSTTINPHFNFAMFSTPDATGNMFDLRILAGARVLYVPSEYHAYPFEKEIILPTNSMFTIRASYQGMLDMIDPESINIVTRQKPTRAIMMGPVFEMNVYKPCKSGACEVVRKPFTIFLAEYSDK